MNPFLPILAGALSSELMVSTDNDLLSLIFPRAFSEIGDSATAYGLSEVGDINDLVTVSSPWEVRGLVALVTSGSLSCDVRWIAPSFSNNLAFSAPGSPISTSSMRVLPFWLPAFLSLSSFASWARLTSRNPRASVKVPRSSKVFRDCKIPYVMLGFSPGLWWITALKTSSLNFFCFSSANNSLEES